MWYPPAPATASGSAPGKKSSPTTLYYCYNGKRAEATAGKWLLFLFFSFLSVSEGTLGRSFAPILGLSVLQGRAVLLSGDVVFVTFILFFFLSVSEGTSGTFFAQILGLFQKRRSALFRGHLAPVSSFTAMLFLLSRFCHGGNG